MDVYLDLEFTGLHKDTTVISLGMVAEDGQKLYIEFFDYDKKQVDDWIEENVVNHLWNHLIPEEYLQDYAEGKLRYHVCNKAAAKTYINDWLSQWLEVRIWSDTLAFDWVLFCDIFGHAFNIPDNLFYVQAFDLSTALFFKGVDPDINREEYAGIPKELDGPKHNALWDAEIILRCVNRVLRENEINSYTK